ncbi:hypothetical protein FF011L_30230 [Roseimaritima multifibrata]|uniref:Uncharacterized protein n=2 Tax=Roseimaritima multifibrata TaxID=1930274 RepID=A0A517MH87_9BACT|nr:hypothetical protein FF011L_30230 [Roseimaritima multifibrata]
MQPLEQMDGRLTLRILPYLIGVIAWLGGKTESPPEKVPFLAPDHLRAFVADGQRSQQHRQKQAMEVLARAIEEHTPP